MRQEAVHVPLSQFARMTPVLKQEEAANPGHVGLFGTATVMPGSQRFHHTLVKPGAPAALGTTPAAPATTTPAGLHHPQSGLSTSSYFGLFGLLAGELAAPPKIDPATTGLPDTSKPDGETRFESEYPLMNTLHGPLRVNSSATPAWWRTTRPTCRRSPGSSTTRLRPVRYDDPFQSGFEYAPHAGKDIYRPINELWS